MIAHGKRWLLDRGGLVALATLALYLWLAPTHIVDGENAHFAALGAVGGAAHPSGYPLYILWLRALAWLPGASPAHTAALATALLGAAQILVLHAACRAWGARALAATLAVGMFAVAPVVLRIHTEAEVFALNGLVIAAVLWIAAAAGPWRGAVRAAALGVIAGLGMANHFTCALIAPVGLLGVVRAMRETRLPRPIVPAIAAAGFLLGLTPYLYLLIAPSGGPSWGHVDSVGALVDLALRRDYGGPFAFAPTGEEVSPLTNLLGLVRTLGRTWLWLPGALGLGVLAIRAWRPRAACEPVWGWRWLALSWLVAGPLLVLRFNLPPSGLGLYVVARFHILPALLLTVPVALGFDALGGWLATRTRSALVQSRALTTAIAFAALAVIAGTSLPHLRRMHTPAVEQEIHNVLRALPPRAVVIGTTDELLFGFAYVEDALGERPDVIYVNWPTMGLAWYRDEISRRGLPLAFSDTEAHAVSAVTQILAQHRRLFVDPAQTTILAAFPHVPYGTLLEIVARGTPAPSLDQILAQEKAIYGTFELGYPTPNIDDEWAAEVHRHYAATWVQLSHALAVAGRSDDAHWAFRIASALAPQAE